jgi:hypothetical protein
MFDILKNTDDNAESEEKVLLAYKRKFIGDDDGGIVLEDMLFDLYFLQPCENEGQQALCNYAKTLLAKIYGVPIESSRLKSLIQKLMKKRRTK